MACATHHSHNAIKRCKSGLIESSAGEWSHTAALEELTLALRCAGNGFHESWDCAFASTFQRAYGVAVLAYLVARPWLRERCSTRAE